MDPLETLLLLRDAVNDRVYSSAVMYLNCYYQWRVKGGFEPNVTWEVDTTGDEFADACAITIQDQLS